MGLRLLILTLGLTAGSWVAGRAYQQAEKNRVFDEAYRHAREVNKPVLNAGCGSLPPYGDVNLDSSPKSVPNFILGNIEEMPFEDKQFAGCIASHILEHTDNPERALKECERVADKVWVIETPLWDAGTWLTPTHKWIIIKASEPKFIEYNPLGGYSLLLSKLIFASGI